MTYTDYMDLKNALLARLEAVQTSPEAARAFISRTGIGHLIDYENTPQKTTAPKAPSSKAVGRKKTK